MRGKFLVAMSYRVKVKYFIIIKLLLCKTSLFRAGYARRDCGKDLNTSSLPLKILKIGMFPMTPVKGRDEAS